MFSFFIGLLVLVILFWVGFKLTGALLLACIWLFFKLPIALLLFVFGLICCCTLILIPVGLWMFKWGLRLLLPGI